MAHVFQTTDYENRKTLRTAARNAITRLQQIEDGVVGANTAQTQRAIADMATYERHLIRIVIGELV